MNLVRQGITHAVDLTSGFEVCHVWVAEGLYNIFEDSIDDTVQLQPGVHVYGGFAGDETTLAEREWKDHATVLSGMKQDSYDKVCHVVTGADDAVLDGFIVTGGGCLETYDTGAGMLNNEASPTVRNCDFMGNDAYEGGGMANWGSSPWIENCGFYDNWSDPAGAAGGMVNDDSSPTILSCRFVNNFGNHGGAINNHDSSPEIINSIFAFNTGLDNDYAMRNNGSAPRIVNSVFYGEQDSVMYNMQDSIAEVSNSIFWNGGEYGIVNDNDSGATVTHSVVQGGYPGEGNISANPHFVSPASADFRLQDDSPCIDAADGDAAPAHDIRGMPRVDDPHTPNTGIGPPWADIGAYEFQG